MQYIYFLYTAYIKYIICIVCKIYVNFFIHYIVGILVKGAIGAQSSICVINTSKICVKI